MVVPIFRDADVIGALGVANRGERTFSEAETRDLIEAGRTLAGLVPTPPSRDSHLPRFDAARVVDRQRLDVGR